MLPIELNMGEEGMTEAELWDQFVQWMIAGGDTMMSYISIMFAFLVMAHYIGAKLTRIQAAIACALFFWASAILIYGVVGYFYRAEMFMNKLLQIDPGRTFFLSTYTIAAMALMMFIGFFVCVLFLYQARREQISN